MASSGNQFLEEYLPYLLRRADQTLSDPFYSVLATYEVGRSEWRVLAVLEELGPLTVAELTAAALSPQPTVTHAVRRLVKRGLISRTPGVNDKRVRIIAMTSSGSTLTQMLIDEARRLEAKALTSANDVADLIEKLRTLTAAVEAHATATDSPHEQQAS